MEDTDVSGGQIRVVEDKTGAKVWIPMHPDLKAIMKLTPHTPGALIKTKYGVGYSENGLANYMADSIDATALPEKCVTHGLRKAASRLLAEAGCTPHQIMAITGQKTLAEVERYTRAAAQKKLAASAMELMPARLGAQSFPNPHDGLGNAAEKPRLFIEGPDEWRSLRESNPSFQIENLTS